MATIIKHNTTGKTYCLLGAGFGTYQSSKPNMFWEIGWQMLQKGNMQWFVSVINKEKLVGYKLKMCPW